MTQFLATPADKSLEGINSWIDIDLSGDIPVNAMGAIFQVVNTGVTDRNYGLRKNGSTDSRLRNIWGKGQCFVIIGVDSARKCEGWINNLNVDFHIVGYTEKDVTLFTNAYDKSLGIPGSFQDIDLSAELPAGAVAAIFEVENISAVLGRDFRLRKYGSIDNRSGNISPYDHFSFIVGVDSNRKCQGRISNTDVNFHLTGYLSRGQAETNGIDRSLGSTGSYVDIDESANAPADATGVFCEICSSGSHNYAVRKDGSSFDIYEPTEKHIAFFCGLEDKKWEGKIGNLGLDWYTLGYFGPGFDVKTKESSASTTVTVQKTKESSISLSVEETFTKESSIGLNLLISPLKSSMIGTRVVNQIPKESSIGTLIKGANIRESSIGLNLLISPLKSSMIGTRVVNQIPKESSIGTRISQTYKYYKKGSVIATTAGAQDNYQLPLLVGESSGASGADINCENHSEDFPNDIRFIREDGITKHHYWVDLSSLEGIAPNRRVSVIIEVAIIPASGAIDFYMYYGEPGDPGESNGENTFEFFDDFDEHYKAACYDSTPSGDVDAHQGVATDGTYFYVTTSGMLYKYNLSWILVDSRNVSGDGPAEQTQINHIFYKDGKLYCGANNYNNDPAKAWVMIYNASDLAPIEYHYLGTNLGDGEGCAYHDGYWWCVGGGASKIEKYNESWEYVDVYNIDFSATGSSRYCVGCQGIIWIDDNIWVTKHEGCGDNLYGIFHWNGSGFDIITKRIPPTIRCTQGLGLDPCGSVVWWAERKHNGVHGDKRVVKSNVVLDWYLNTQKWEESGTASLADSECELNGNDRILGKTSFGYGYEVRAKAKANEQDVWFVGWADSNAAEPANGIWIANSDYTHPDDFDMFRCESRMGGEWMSHPDHDNNYDFRNTYYTYYLQRISAAINYCQKDILIWTRIADLPVGNLAPHLRVWNSSQESTLTIDWVFVRKYASPEPTWGIWDQEEEVGTSSKGSSISLSVEETFTKESSASTTVIVQKTKESSASMTIEGTNTKESLIGISSITDILRKGFFYTKLDNTILYGIKEDNFRISKEINQTPSFEFEIANCAENRAAISTGIEDDFKIYWQHHGVDTLWLTGVINSDGIEYVSHDSIKISGFASYVKLSWPLCKHLDPEDAEPVNKVFVRTGTFTDFTTEANNATINDVICSMGVIGHALYIGDTQPFWGAQIKYSTKGVRTGQGRIELEYSKGLGIWASLDVLDESDAFTEDPGTYNLIIAHPPSDWKRNTVNGVKKYWIRYRVATGGYTTNPKLDQLYLVNVDVYRAYYFNKPARVILEDVLIGTGYTMDETDTCPEDIISIIAEYESPLRVIAAIPNALTWTDVDGSKKAYQWWIDDSKKVHIKKRRGTTQPDDITGDMTIFNNHEDYFHLSNQLIGLGPRDGLSQMRAIVRDKDSITTHQLREIAVSESQIGNYDMLKKSLQKKIAVSKEPMQRIRGNVSTQFWGIREYEVGDMVTLHQDNWNVSEKEFQIVKVDIGPTKTTLDLGISQDHLEGLRDNMQRQLTLNNVEMHGSTTLIEAGPVTHNYQRVDAETVYPAKLEIEIPSTVKKIHKVLLSWTLGPYHADVGPSTGEVPAHDHGGDVGNGGGYESFDAGAGGAFTPAVVDDGAFTPQMTGGKHAHLVEDEIALEGTSIYVGVLQDPNENPDAGKVFGIKHSHSKGRTGPPDDVADACLGVRWKEWCEACNYWLVSEQGFGSFAEASHWHLNSNLFTGETEPSAYINLYRMPVMTSINAYMFSTQSNQEAPEAHLHAGVDVLDHGHAGVDELAHGDHTIPALGKHKDHSIAPEDGVALGINYDIYEEPGGTDMELLINGESVGIYTTAPQIEIRIDGWLNSGNNTVALQPTVTEIDKKGGATLKATGLLFVEPVKF